MIPSGYWLDNGLEDVQKRVSIASLLSFESLAYKIGSWLMFGNSDFGNVPTTQMVRMAHFA